ncbi:MAG: hypothetical protein AAFN12_01400 [Cyanobacteria bacterium J06560_2]
MANVLNLKLSGGRAKIWLVSKIETGLVNNLEEKGTAYEAGDVCVSEEFG